jgi:hypothetical protein
MAISRKMVCVAVAVVLNAMVSGPSRAAPEATEWGTLAAVQAGWVVDQMLVFHNAPLKNPDNCKVTTNGYITSVDHPGHTLFHTMLLSAVLTRREVQFVVAGCREDRPLIVSVGIR